MVLPVNYNDTHYTVRRKVRNEYVRIQSGKCYHCSALLKGRPSGDVLKLKINTKLFPEGFFKWPIHLHHSHKTGLTIGAVHNYCNAVLWQYHGE